MSTRREGPRGRTAKSAWARDTQERFGRGSIYWRGEHEPRPVCKRAERIAPGSAAREERIRDLTARINEDAAKLKRMEAMLRSLEHSALYTRPLMPPPHEAISSGDCVVEVLANLPSQALGITSQVCTAWRGASSDSLLRSGPMQSPLALRPLMAAIPEVRELMRLSAVCSMWRGAVYAERMRLRRAVEAEARTRLTLQGPEAPFELSAVPFVDKLLRVADRIGFEVVRCGGLLASIRRAYDALGCCLEDADGRSLAAAPDMSLIARPADAVPLGEHQPHLFVVAGVERIEPPVRRLVDILATGLMLVAPDEDAGQRGGDEAADDDEDASALLGLIFQPQEDE
jgi:hypothetical protein